MALDVRHNKHLLKRYNWLGELMGTKDILKYFKDLSPSERGGYLRLNRLIKERFIKQIYKFCLDNNIFFGTGDPDYKELTMSGCCCCGLPDDYKENRGLENWSRDNLGFHIKEARKRYHLSGETVQIKFSNVYNAERSPFLKSTSIYIVNDNIAVSNKSASERKGISYLDMARDTWNNLRSPGNPRNYFHGKLLPIRIDEDENYVYVYNPSEYESRWIDEGVDLTR